MSEIETNRAKTVDKKQPTMHLINLLRYWANILVISFLSISISWTAVLKKFNFRVLTLIENYETIYTLEDSKSPGLGLVYAGALKAAKYAIGTHLQFVFNECIQNSVFPTILKHAYVTPIHKKGSTTQVCNYRPFGPCKGNQFNFPQNIS